MIDAAVVPGSFVRLHDGYVLVAAEAPKLFGPTVITDLEWCETDDADTIHGVCVGVNVRRDDVLPAWGSLATSFVGETCCFVLVTEASQERHKRLAGTIVVIHDHEMFAWVTATSSLW